MRIAVIGLGLIGGSMVKSLREVAFTKHVIGVDQSETHQQKALELGFVDECMSLQDAVQNSDLIIVATPVNTIANIVQQVLDLVTNQTVIDVGSTKSDILKQVINHPNRQNYVACHPMAGTEYSGPEAAVSGLFNDKYVVICNQHDSDPARVELLYQEAEAHDMHVAYVSHISHISSFALAITVLNKEVDEDKIFELASTGFSSTVRLAKSSPKTWVPIFEQNRDNVLEVLDEHISVLSNFRSHLIKKNYDKFHDMICEANNIKKIIK
jgi:prephenate dehydrogenase